MVNTIFWISIVSLLTLFSPFLTSSERASKYISVFGKCTVWQTHLFNVSVIKYILYSRWFLVKDTSAQSNFDLLLAFNVMIYFIFIFNRDSCLLHFVFSCFIVSTTIPPPHEMNIISYRQCTVTAVYHEDTRHSRAVIFNHAIWHVLIFMWHHIVNVHLIYD